MDWPNIISLIIQTIAILGTLAAFLGKLLIKLELMIQQHKQFRDEVNVIKTKVDELSRVVVDIARQDTRIINLEARVHELSTRLHNHIAEDLGKVS